MVVERLGEHEAERLWTIRLAALRDAPDVFGGTFDDAAALDRDLCLHDERRAEHDGVALRVWERGSGGVARSAGALRERVGPGPPGAVVNGR